MAGYVIATVEVTNADGYQEYSRQVPATIAKYGGRYLVRGGKTAVYTPLRPIRQANWSARIAFFEGIAKGTGQSGALNLG